MVSKHVLLAVWLSVLFLQPSVPIPAAGAQISPPQPTGAYAAGLATDLRPHCDLCWNPAPLNQHQLRSTGSPLHGHHIKKGHRPHRKLGWRSRAPHSSLRRSLPHRALSATDGPGYLLDAWQVQAIDGDTIRYGMERIRVRGIDTPELTEAGGFDATQRLARLLKDGPIRLVPHGRDLYGRMLADVYVNDQNVAELLKVEGYAKPRP
ncbi:MAG TPA: thermonuclease family protein [Nitrospiraceae bacterium]|jgi:micrococcal nuclease|nr:thermonuclease family protein [Nitrospiraceae bacterium]